VGFRGWVGGRSRLALKGPSAVAMPGSVTGCTKPDGRIRPENSHEPLNLTLDLEHAYVSGHSPAPGLLQELTKRSFLIQGRTKTDVGRCL
jgi:hypothetical protein